MKNKSNYIANVTLSEFSALESLKYLFQHPKTRYQIKKLELRECEVESVTIDTIDKLLQILVPLSSKEIELRNRLSKEITDDMKNNLPTHEIEKLRKKIKNDIYQQDENELTYYGDDEKVSQNQVLTEMLSMYYCKTPSTLTDNLKDFITSELTSKRLESSLKNLKALEIRGIEENEDDLFGEICTILLNNICNQLESLHIDDDLIGLQEWKFFENNYSNVNDDDDDNDNKDDDDAGAHVPPWFPANVRHLCVFSPQKSSDNDNEEEEEEEDDDDDDNLWHYISHQNFPKLQHLRVYITDVVNKLDQKHLCGSTASVVPQLAELIKNGLKSFCLTLAELEMQHIGSIDKTPEFFQENCLLHQERRMHVSFPLLSFVRNLLQLLQQCRCSLDPFSKRDEFILKLELRVGLPSYDADDAEICDMLEAMSSDEFKQEFVTLLNQILMIFIWLKYVFKSAMLCFKVKFYGDDIMLQAVQSVCDSVVEEQVSMKSDTSHVVDTSVQQRGDTLWFACVWKNFVTAAPNLSGNCAASHCEPYCDFQCDLCKPICWLSQ